MAGVVFGTVAVGVLAIAALRYDRTHGAVEAERASRRKADEDRRLDDAAARYGLGRVAPPSDVLAILGLTTRYETITRSIGGVLRGRNVWIVEYRVVLPKGQISHHVVSLTPTGFEEPWMRIQPHAYALAAGTPFATVHTESGEFDRAFHVACPDPRFATTVLAPELMAWLLDHAQSFEFELSDRWLRARRTQVTGALEPDELGVQLAAIVEFAERIPPVVADLYPPAGDDGQH
jgi:hypothetical protein